MVPAGVGVGVGPNPNFWQPVAYPPPDYFGSTSGATIDVLANPPSYGRDATFADDPSLMRYLDLVPGDAAAVAAATTWAPPSRGQQHYKHDRRVTVPPAEITGDGRDGSDHDVRRRAWAHSGANKSSFLVSGGGGEDDETMSDAFGRRRLGQTGPSRDVPAVVVVVEPGVRIRGSSSSSSSTDDGPPPVVAERRPQQQYYYRAPDGGYSSAVRGRDEFESYRRDGDGGDDDGFHHQEGHPHTHRFASGDVSQGYAGEAANVIDDETLELALQIAVERSVKKALKKAVDKALLEASQKNVEVRRQDDTNSSNSGEVATSSSSKDDNKSSEEKPGGVGADERVTYFLVPKEPSFLADHTDLLILALTILAVTIIPAAIVSWLLNFLDSNHFPLVFVRGGFTMSDVWAWLTRGDTFVGGVWSQVTGFLGGLIGATRIVSL